jgi:HD-GYP domain-containing protein (c-di-GMP phosphodiesterase class II)
MTDPIDYHKDLCRLISYLMSAVSNVIMYPSTHPHVHACIKETQAHLADLLKAKREITLVLLKDRLLVDEIPLIFQGSYGNAFMDMMGKNAIDRITFHAGLPFNHLEGFIKAFALPGAEAIRSTRFITLSRIDLKYDGKANGDSENRDDELASVIDIRISAPGQVVEDIYGKIRTGETVEVDVLYEAIANLMDNIHKVNSPLVLLASLKSADEYTFTHVVNVGILTLALSETLGFRNSYLTDIGVAALLHDIGKVLIAEEILQKKGHLMPDELETMQSHALKGARYLMNINGISKLTVLVALEHHIKYDGSGYPCVRRGWKTNIVSQMVSIADVFDALRTRRPYREPLSPEAVEKTLLRESGSSFNPYLLERFLKLAKTPTTAQDLQKFH